ncbi:MAG: ferrochelatase [Acidimicrobiaceae bacterium]|nr:ferrochelatase [Acidimicrobiaceae bacterium]
MSEIDVSAIDGSDIDVSAIDGSEIDAVLLVGFGGPEGPDDVVPFLERVTAGRKIPPERLAEVGAHYQHFGGVSPINEQCRAIRRALQSELDSAGHALPVYWGNRNWHPLLAETIAQMADDGVGHAVALVTSAYSSYSGCRQYLEDLDRARTAAGADAVRIDKIRPYFDHPGFVAPFIASTREALDRLASTDPAPLVFTAHSIPAAMAERCDYETQLRATMDLVAEAASPQSIRHLVWQSRSGPPSVPWLEPDINDHLRWFGAQGFREAVLVPIGFVSDHVEVVWDLDHEAAATAAALGIRIERATTPGTAPDPDFIAMARELIEERLGISRRRALSALPARPYDCAPGCCTFKG